MLSVVDWPCLGGDMNGRIAVVLLPPPPSEYTCQTYNRYLVPADRHGRHTCIKYGVTLRMMTLMYQIYHKLVVGIIIKISNHCFLL